MSVLLDIIEKKQDFIGKKLIDHDPYAEGATTEIVDMRIDENAFFTVEGKEFSCGISLNNYGGFITPRENELLAFGGQFNSFAILK